jgi:hypothetical protein
LTPLEAAAAEECIAGGGIREDDFWEVDLLPEGLAHSSLDPAGDVVWMPGAKPTELSNPSFEFREDTRRHREQAWETVLLPRLHRYLANQADWLLVVSLSADYEMPEEFRREPAAVYEGLEPSASEWRHEGVACYRLNASSAPQSTVLIEPASRLVRLSLA